MVWNTLIPYTYVHTYRQFQDMVWNMLPKRVARYLRRGRNYAEPFGQASGGRGRGQGHVCGGRRGLLTQVHLGRRGMRQLFERVSCLSVLQASDGKVVVSFSSCFGRPGRGHLELLIGNASVVYPQVSILFCDIVSYTNMSSEMTPDHIVNLLNNVYT